MAMTPDFTQTERRAEPRQKVFLGCKITTEVHFEPFECVVRDFTADGARIALRGNERLPDIFRLAIPAKQCVLRARVIWRDAGTIGVYFDGFEFGSPKSGSSMMLQPPHRWPN